MLEKNVDTIVIGNSYLSSILSLKLLLQKKKVLLLDDSRLRYGELFTGFLSYLERNIIELWGKENGITPLINIDQYLKERPITFMLDDVLVRLGDSPSRNYRELKRKFYYSFPRGRSNSRENIDFSNIFLSYCDKLVQLIYQTRNDDNFSTSLFFRNGPSGIKNIFNVFSASLQGTDLSEKELWTLRTFIYMARGYFQKKLSFNGDDFELYYLLLCLLSPQYELDHQGLLNDLITFYQKAGGNFKKTEVQEWLFSNYDNWSLQLASYDGVIHSKMLYFLGGIPQGLPIKLFPEQKLYRAVQVRWTFNDTLGVTIAPERIFVSSSGKLGTNYPFWTASLYEHKIECKVFVVYNKCSRVEFIREEILSLLRKELTAILTEFPSQLTSEKIEFGHEIYVADEKFSADRKDLPAKSQAVSIIDHSTPEKPSRLKNVKYLGPCQQGQLGLLSTLLEII